MAKGKGRSNSRKAYIAGYNYASQKIKRMERALKRQPNDKQLAESLEAFKKNPKSQMTRSGKKGGWVNYGKWPLLDLGNVQVNIPSLEDQSQAKGFSPQESFMKAASGTKRRIAQIMAATRHAARIRGEQEFRARSAFKKTNKENRAARKARMA